MTTNAGAIQRVARDIEDWIRTPFYEWEYSWLSVCFKAPVMFLSMGASLVPRSISLCLAPGVTMTTASGTAMSLPDTIIVLCFNILGMPAYHARKEGRKSVYERIESIFQIIFHSNADMVKLQEVHAGSPLEQRIIQQYENRYRYFFHNMGKKLIFHGSGLMTFTWIANAESEFIPFESSVELETQKGMEITTLSDENGPSLKIANVHMQSGHRSGQVQARTDQARQIYEVAQSSPVAFFACGDSNIDRMSNEYSKRCPFYHTHIQIDDGFKSDEERMQPTLADFEGKDVVLHAVDMFVQMKKGAWKISAIEIGDDFRDCNTSPSDHAWIKATLARAYEEV